MPAVQNLKKHLRGIRSTKKLTKAMKTVSTVKFSKLNTIYSSYSSYSKECQSLLSRYGKDLLKPLGNAAHFAPEAFVVIAANKGMCGSFNAELLSFAKKLIDDNPNHLVIACGKRAINYFSAKKVDVFKEYIFDDIPTYEGSNTLLKDLVELRKQGEISKVHIIYQKYINMMYQNPGIFELFSVNEEMNLDNSLVIPDVETIISKTAKNVFSSILYELVLETAIGAQAATLMTMRKAYDTASEKCAELESQINRLRQSAVTADVIETAEHY